MLDWLMEEAIALYGLVVVGFVLFVGASIGHFFGSAGDQVFKKKD